MTDPRNTATPRWGSLRTLTGPADYVPAALERMLNSHTEDDASAAYWQLDNRIVVQGQLFEAAEHVARAVMDSVCSGQYSPTGLARGLDLLVEIANGEADESEVEFGNGGLGERCRHEIATRITCIKDLAAHRDERILLGALDLVDRLDSASGRAAFLATLPREGWPESALRRLREMR